MLSAKSAFRIGRVPEGEYLGLFQVVQSTEIKLKNLLLFEGPNK